MDKRHRENSILYCWMRVSGIPPNLDNNNDYELKHREKRSRKAIWLIVTFFIFDSLSEYPTTLT